MAVTVVLGATLVASHLGRPASIWFALAGVFPLFVNIKMFRPGLAATLAALWGVCVAYLPSELSRSGAWSATATAAVIALPALHAWLGATVTCRIRFSPLFLAFSWIGVELGFVSIGFERGLIGTGLDGGPAVGWLTSTLGTVFAGFFVASLGAYVALALAEAHRMGRCIVRCLSLRVSVELIREAISYQQHCWIQVLATRSTSPRGPPQATA